MNKINNHINRILILCRRDDREDYDTQRSMLRGLKDNDAKTEYTGMDYEDLIFKFDGNDLTITDSVSGHDIAEFDAVFLIGWFKTKQLDDVARAVSHYAAAKGIPCKNTEAFTGRSFSKLSQCVIAALNDIQVTPFLFCLDQEKLLLEAKNHQLGEPYIAKAITTSRGRDNYLIDAYEQLVAAVRAEYEVPKHFILQEYMPNDGDYRIIIMGGHVRLVMYRQSQSDSHLNNTSQGGSATLVEHDTVPQKVLDDAVKMSKILNREVSGVDMIMHKESGEYYFLESNNMPQLSTGSFVSEKLAALDQYLTEIANDNR